MTGRDFTYLSPDGLRLAGREHGTGNPGLPVVCLPGHSRTTRDFEPLAEQLAGDTVRPRRVLSFDARGRGRSDWDPEPERYTPPVELGDLLAAVDHFGITRAAFIGTSRGGIVTALAAGARPGLVEHAVLNDVGPVLEIGGLLEIQGYMGRTPDPTDWAEAAAGLKAKHERRFTAFGAAEWQSFARMTFADRAGRPAVDYDPALALGYAGLTVDTVLPAAWEIYDALRDIPVLLLHGENSGLLTADTVAKMRTRYPGLEVETVPGQGHAPLILPGPLMDRVAGFLNGAQPD